VFKADTKLQLETEEEGLKGFQISIEQLQYVWWVRFRSLQGYGRGRGRVAAYLNI